MMADFKDKKFNDEEIAKYAKLFNSICAENNITPVWWDTNFLVNKNQLSTFPKIIDAIMSCYPKESYSKRTEGFVEELADQAVRNMKTGWNLGNTFDATKASAVLDQNTNIWTETIGLTGLETEVCWYQPKTTKEMIHYVKTLGFNTVRLPVTWAGHLDLQNQIDENWLNRVKQVVDWILAEDMYCIINVHHDGGANGWARACESSYKQFKNRFVSIINQICNTFESYDERLLFAGLNELLDERSFWGNPSDECIYWTELWNQLFVDTVRKSGGNNINRNLIVMAPAGKSNSAAIKKFHLPKDRTSNHLIFEFHNYDPQGFCWHQNSAGTNKDETPYWSDEIHGTILRNSLKDLLEGIKNYNVPVICGEYAAWPKIIE